MFTILHTTPASRTFAAIANACSGLADEASQLAHALLQPGRIIDEVERMRALQLQAQACEATDPARAAQLYRRLGRMGMR